jgi:hypothetical protein
LDEQEQVGDRGGGQLAEDRCWLRGRHKNGGRETKADPVAVSDQHKSRVVIKRKMTRNNNKSTTEEGVPGVGDDHLVGGLAG